MREVKMQAATGTGNGTVLNVTNQGSAVIQVEGTFVGTVTFESSVDRANYVAIQAINLNDSSIATTTTGEGLFCIPCAGLSFIRARVSAYTSGTINATGIAVQSAPAALALAVTLAAGSALIGTVGIDQTTPGTTDAVTVTTLPTSIQGPGNPTIDSYASAAINAAAAADQELVAAPGADKQIWVYGLFMMADTGAGTVTLQDEDDAVLSGTMAVSDEGGWVLPISGNFAMPWIKVATNKALEADCATSTIDGIITYAIVSV